MPILATGTRRPHDRGFTLVEVLVTLLLLGLVTGVALSLPSDGANLSREAQQLAARIHHAQREAILTNRAVEIVVAQADSHFRVRRAGRWEALTDGPFGSRPWNAGVQAVMAGRGTHGVRFDPSGTTDPALIRLSSQEKVVEVTVDMQGMVAIHER